MSAETALLLLVAAAHVGLDSVSVEADFDAVEVDTDHVFADLLNSKVNTRLSFPIIIYKPVFLPFGLLLQFLAIDADDDLVLLVLEFDLVALLIDDLDLEFFAVLVDLLDEDGEAGLGRAVLGDDRVAGGQGGAVDHVVEGVDAGRLDFAFGLVGGVEVLADRAVSDGDERNAGGETDGLHAEELVGGLDGQVGVATADGVNGQLEDDAAFLSLARFPLRRPESVGLDEVVDAAEDGLGGAAEFVLGNDVELVEAAGLDEDVIGVHAGEFLAFGVLEPAVLFLVLLELHLHGELGLLLRSPLGLEEGLEFAVLLLLHFLEAARRFGESEVSLTLDGPLVALVAEHGLATSVEGDLAVADFTVALGAELKLNK